ncbi:MAG: hypothetical protein M0R32_08370 [Candidatus Cloacimonetes bacterium]|jgi:hypothetical protein|nr:hypothetical protein [Candidatus Cloacimonadota bacterium]
MKQEELYFNLFPQLIIIDGKKKILIDAIPNGEKLLHVSSPNCRCKPDVQRDGWWVEHKPLR